MRGIGKSPAWLQRPLLIAASLLALLLLLHWNPLQHVAGAGKITLDGIISFKQSANTTTSGLTLLDTPGVEALLEVPDNCKAVLFVAHGCQHSATDFWKASEACPSCIGLPEEVNITQRALARGYAVLAVSSSDREQSKCWGLGPVTSPSVDMMQVQKVLQELDSPKWPQLRGKPQYALGASSGGAFVLSLALLHPLTAVAAQIMATRTSVLEADPHPPGRKYPPAMFIHMPRDQLTAEQVEINVEALKKLGVAASEIKVYPQAVTASWLQRKLGLEAEAAASVHHKLREGGILDSSDTLVENPRQSRWKDLLQPELQAAAPGNMTLRADCMSEVLNLAYAGHEIISDTTDEMLDWFELELAAVPHHALVMPTER